MNHQNKKRTPEEIHVRARELRKVMTPAEQALWSRLRNRQLCGLKFRRQHPVGPFIADFYCAECRLIIEVDGGIHQRQADQDADRTARLEEYSYRVVRVKNEEISADLESVLQKIAAYCGTETLLP